MSMNLHIEVDGVELELYQTPTYITKMCLAPNRDGKVSKSRAVNTYLEYVNSTANGVHETAEEAKEERERVNKHITKVLTAVTTAKKVEVYAL